MKESPRSATQPPPIASDDGKDGSPLSKKATALLPREGGGRCPPVCHECGSTLYDSPVPHGTNAKVKSLRSPDAVFQICRRMTRLDQEHFRVLALDVRLQLIAAKTVAIGSSAECPVYPREVFRFALMAGANGIVAVHCHPSGDPSPSEQDRRLTAQLREVGDLVGVRLIDHVIVAKRGWFSFAQERGSNEAGRPPEMRPHA